jgi:ABC-type glycerol-3-phosphate transport system substrate-binding protein
MISGDGAAYVFDGAEGLESLTYLQSLLIDGCATAKMERFGDRVDFGAGEVLFAIGSFSDLRQYHTAVDDGAGFNWSISPLPSSLDERTVLVHGPSLLIFKATPEKQLASWLFLKWFTEPGQQARWARATNSLPVRVSAVDLLEETFAENPQYAKGVSFIDNELANDPGVTGYGECRDAIEEMLTAVIELEHPETWLTSTENACNASLEEATGQ